MNQLSTPESAAPIPPLSWARDDLEHRLGFASGRFTRVNNVFSLILGAVCTVLFYLALLPARGTYLGRIFVDMGPVPYSIAGFFFWSAIILLIKHRKLALQRRTLACEIVPRDPTFVLSPRTVDTVMDLMHETTDDPKRFVLFNRILIALSNLRNIGRIADVDDILRGQAENGEATMETSYSLVRTFVWAIPVLGFIGTVLGLSQAISSFSGVLATASDLSQLKPALQQVTGGLALAFETTLQGLVAAMIIQLMLTGIKKGEEEFLDACSEYCVRHIVGRLRLVPFEREED